jgi:hypothetical protein
MRARSAWVAWGTFVLLLAAQPADAANVRVSSKTIGQGYQLITSSGDVLKRSRLHQLLGLSVFDIGGGGDNAVSFVSQFRFDSDFGITHIESSSIEQLTNNQLSIMYGYLEIRGLAKVLDLRLGRQLIIDDMDFTLMDGLRATYHSPVHVGVELIGGVEVKNAFLGMISSTQLEVDGDGGAYGDDKSGGPDEEMGLVMGGSVFLEGLRDHHGKLGYRRIMTPDSEVDAERAFINYHYRIHPKLHLSAAAAWDFVIADLSDIRAEIRAPGIADVLDLQLAYLHLIPTFEGSSIFNVFSTQPLNDIDMRARFHISKSVNTYLGGYLRLFGQQPREQDETDAKGIKDIGIRVGGRMALSDRGRLELDASRQTGYGDMTVIDMGGRYDFMDHRLGLSGRLTTVVFEDALQDKLAATSFGVQVGVNYLVRRLARFHLMTELNTNQIEKVQFRIFGLVDLELWF